MKADGQWERAHAAMVNTLRDNRNFDSVDLPDSFEWPEVALGRRR